MFHFNESTLQLNYIKNIEKILIHGERERERERERCNQCEMGTKRFLREVI